MGQFPFAFERINETTWAYLSSFLMIALFFKFNRFWSIRNLDLLLIILLAPGIIMVHVGHRWQTNEAQVQSEQSTDEPSAIESSGPTADSANAPDPLATAKSEERPETKLENYALLQRWGYYWLFLVGILFLIRCIWDHALIRRPILESNLTIGGQVFLGCTLMMFLFLNVVSSTPTPEDVSGAQGAVKLLQREAAVETDLDQLIQRGPGYTIFSVLPVIPSFGGNEVLEVDLNQRSGDNRYVVAAKSLAILSQIAIVFGLIMISYWHFKNFRSGIEAATIYLILPYTAVFTGHVMHALPAALVVWAVAFLKRPLVAGILIGLSIGVSYYPFFLLALWVSFYWDRGKWPFIYGVLMSIGLCAAGLLFTSVNIEQFLTQLQRMLGIFAPRMEGLGGIWALGWDQAYRMPLLAAFIAFSASFAFWPLQKNIGTLISCSAAIMVALQFWHGFGGGTYLAYYMPLALTFMLRPNVDGRVALSEISRAQTDRRLKSDGTGTVLPVE